MAATKLGLLLVSGLVLAGCQQEAGGNPAFPPIGGARPVVMPDAGMPTDLTPTEPATNANATTTEGAGADGTTEALTAAVNDALAATASQPAVEAVPTEPAVEEQPQSEPQPAQPEQVVIQPGQMPELVSSVNIITYARETTNAVGERLYRRPMIRRTVSASQCRKFASDDDAQRNFLANGGPENDPLNLDPDGDGFACGWDPEAYRALVLQ